MSEQSKVRIAGEWLGTYAYKGIQAALPPVRFDANQDHAQDHAEEQPAERELVTAR